MSANTIPDSQVDAPGSMPHQDGKSTSKDSECPKVNNASPGGHYLAMLVGVLPAAPILAAIVTIITYVNTQEPGLLAPLAA